MEPDNDKFLVKNTGAFSLATQQLSSCESAKQNSTDRYDLLTLDCWPAIICNLALV